MIETEIDSQNPEVRRIAKQFINCGEPIQCASKWVSANIGDAPNVLTSIVTAMGEMGKPYMAFSAKVGGKVSNELWDYEKDIEYHVDLENSQLKKRAYGYLTPIETSEQSLFRRLAPVAGILATAFTGYSFLRK